STISRDRTLQTPEGFGELPLKSADGKVVRLRDVAQIELAAENNDTVVKFNGEPGTFIGIFPTPAANPLDTADAVIAELPAIQASLPEGMTITLVYDSSRRWPVRRKAAPRGSSCRPSRRPAGSPPPCPASTVWAGRAASPAGRRGARRSSG